MQEDRRPNVGGVPIEPDQAPPTETSSDDLEREARLLRDRRRVDGHEPEGSRPEDEGTSG